MFGIINRSFSIIIILVAIMTQLPAQIAGERMNIDVKKLNGDNYLMPLIGGFNNPQFTEADFNNDGIMDMLVFDRAGDLPLTFINNGTANEIDYVFAPEYAKNYPKDIDSWALMADYNSDGAYDIFTYSNSPGIPGIEAYRGYFDSENRLAFELIRNYTNDYDLLSYPHSSGLELEIYAAFVDIPAFLDVDGDGDMDVLNFNQAGNKMDYYENQSAEMGFGNDSLIFENANTCWGLFVEGGTSADITLSNNPNECADENFFVAQQYHAGSTLACWDYDDDGDLEILVGDITIDNLSFLKANTTGVNENPWFDFLDPIFPSYDVPAKIHAFAAPFVMDVNNDGRKDVLVSPNDQGASENINVGWYYENTTTSGEGIYDLIQKDFLVEDCIDLGQGSKPAFFDYNADGLMDIIIGTDGFYTELGDFDSRLVLFENIGTVSTPAYQMVDEDWLSFSEYTDRNLAPVFGDLDGDGDEDLLVGQGDGDLFYVENKGNDGPALFTDIIPEYQSIFGGQKCVPAIGDLDNDGLMDIITGYKQGRLAFFKNTGTIGAPSFEGDKSLAPNIDGMGGVDVRVENTGTLDQRGYASPKVFLKDGTTPQIIAGNYFSNIYIFDNITANLSGTFDMLSNDYAEINEGHQVAMDIADIDNDGYYEIVVGNYRGGIALYETDLVSDSTIDVEDLANEKHDFKVIPNPSRNYIEIVSDMDISQGEIGILDINGRWVKEKQKGKSLFIEDLPSGVYIVAFNFGEQQIMERIIKL